MMSLTFDRSSPLGIGDVASIVGVLVGIVGFIITIVSVLRSKNAAQRAQEAVLGVRRDLRHQETATEFAAALATIDEIKRLQREKAWKILPDRYAALRKSLIVIRTANPELDGEHQKTLQAAIALFARIEGEIEKGLATDASTLDVVQSNSVVSKQADRLHAVLTELKQKIGR